MWRLWNVKAGSSAEWPFAHLDPSIFAQEPVCSSPESQVAPSSAPTQPQMVQQQERMSGNVDHCTQPPPDDDHDKHFQNEIRALKIEIQRLDDEHKSETQRLKVQHRSDMRSVQARLRRYSSEISQLKANQQQGFVVDDQKADYAEKRFQQIQADFRALRSEVASNIAMPTTPAASDQPQQSTHYAHHSSQHSAKDPGTYWRPPIARVPSLFRGYQSMNPFD